MKKLGIIGCGWLGNHLAEYFSDRCEIFVTTTTQSKIEDFKSKGYQTILASFSGEPNGEIKEWEKLSDLNVVVITIPLSKRRDMENSSNKQKSLLRFLGNYRGQLFLMSSTGIYPQDEKVFTEETVQPKEVETEGFILEKFPQTNILRLAGLMGDNRLLKNYNVTNLDQPVNHVHYHDVCLVIEKMIDRHTESKVYNVVAPIHPTKEAVLNAQKDLPFSGEDLGEGRIISSEKLINDLNFTFRYPDPKNFHKV